MHIVFIVGSYYPNYSAVGKCVGNVAEVLAKENKVTVICEKNSQYQEDKEVYNNQTILRVMTPYKVFSENIENKKKKSHSTKKYIYDFFLKFLKSNKILKLMFSKTTVKKDLVNEYLSVLTNIKEDIDLVVPASMPFESVVAAKTYKEKYSPNTILLPYLFDKFTDSKTLHRFKVNKLLKRKNNIQLEKDSLYSADSIFAMNTLKRFYNEELPEINNILYVEHPLVVPNVSVSNTGSGVIKLAYVGGFYKKYVEPNYLLSLLSHSSIDGKCSFYTIGSCNKIIEAYERKYPLIIESNGSVDKETANKKISESDILISVAEKSGQQLSSKIFDYISTGKPIVHFYTNKNDANLKILKKYPLALCIQENKNMFEENIRRFDNFCKGTYRKNVSWEKIISLYPEALPIYTADLIKKIYLSN